MTSTWKHHARTRSGGFRLTEHIGEISLACGYLGTEIIAHECAHAALGWHRRKRLDIDRDEEAFAENLGYLARQVVAGLRRRGLIAP
jgi:hypothetical protein